MKKNTTTTLFIIIQTLLFILTLTSSGTFFIIFAYSSIVLSFLFSLTFSSNHLIQTGLLFTVIADFFLLILTPRNQQLAMTSFTITQLFYYTYLLKSTNKKTVNIITRAVITLTIEIITILILKDKFDYLSAISMFYYTNLVLNTIFAFIKIKTYPLIAFGLLLFLICDTLVGLQEATNVYITLSTSSILYKISHSSFNFVWFFYIPSQTLLSLNKK